MLQPDVLLPHHVMHEEGWDPPNQQKASQDLYLRIIICSLDNYEFVDSTSDLDTHVNMCVFGKNFIVILIMGRIVDLKAFATKVGGLNEVPIVDVIIAYDCPRSRRMFYLVPQNVLYVESMENNLISSFILREVGLRVNDIPKIH